MKEYWNLIKNRIELFVVTNWNSNRIFDKGKIIFIGVVLFFIIVNLLYSLFT